MTTATTRFAAVIAAAVCWLAASLSASAIEIQEVTSPKGIKAWLVEEHALPLIAMNFSFGAGGATDPDDKVGISHFLSGMLDEGAGKLDSEAFRVRRDELSLRLSFESSSDHFRGSFRALSGNRDASFALLKLALTAPRFDAEPLERMRGQILLNLQDEAEQPEEIAFDTWRRVIFAGHPYARNDHGSPESIARITADDLRGKAAELFTRDRLKVAVVGDVDAATLGRLIDDSFGALPAIGKPLDVPEARPTEGPQLTIVERDIPQSIIQFGHSGIKRSDPDFITAYVMNDIIGGSDFASRLTEEIREKRGLTYSVYSELYTLDRGGLFLGGAATRNDKALETVELVKSELKRFAEEGPTPEELADVKTYITGSYSLRFDSSTKIASQLLGIQEENLGIDYIERRNGLVEAVTIEDVKRMARRLINSDKLVFTVVGRPEGLKP